MLLFLLVAAWISLSDAVGPLVPPPSNLVAVSSPNLGGLSLTWVAPPQVTLQGYSVYFKGLTIPSDWQKNKRSLLRLICPVIVSVVGVSTQSKLLQLVLMERGNQQQN